MRLRCVPAGFSRANGRSSVSGQCRCRKDLAHKIKMVGGPQLRGPEGAAGPFAARIPMKRIQNHGFAFLSHTVRSKYGTSTDTEDYILFAATLQSEAGYMEMNKFGNQFDNKILRESDCIHRGGRRRKPQGAAAQ
eukprot:1183994-Prorocentrum_minimum.AAC.2